MIRYTLTLLVYCGTILTAQAQTPAPAAPPVQRIPQGQNAPGPVNTDSFVRKSDLANLVLKSDLAQYAKKSDVDGLRADFERLLVELRKLRSDANVTVESTRGLAVPQQTKPY